MAIQLGDRFRLTKTEAASVRKLVGGSPETVKTREGFQRYIDQALLGFGDTPEERLMAFVINAEKDKILNVLANHIAD